MYYWKHDGDTSFWHMSSWYDIRQHECVFVSVPTMIAVFRTIFSYSNARVRRCLTVFDNILRETLVIVLRHAWLCVTLTIRMSSGKYSLEGAVTCTDCPAGRYGSTQGLGTANCSGLCLPGFYGSAPAQPTAYCNGQCPAGLAALLPAPHHL